MIERVGPSVRLIRACLECEEPLPEGAHLNRRRHKGACAMKANREQSKGWRQDKINARASAAKRVRKRIRIQRTANVEAAIRDLGAWTGWEQ